MQLKILLPTEIFLNCEVTKIVAEAANGHFCIKPRHIDFVTILVPGLLHYFIQNDEDFYIAIDEGTMVKNGPLVIVSIRHAIAGTKLEDLKSAVHSQYKTLDEQERLARSALARLEAGVVRRFINLEEAM